MAPAWALEQPVMHQACLVGGCVVEHEVHVEIRGYCRLDLVQERPEPRRAVTSLAGADHRARPHVQRRTGRWCHGACSRGCIARSGRASLVGQGRCPRWPGSAASRPHTAPSPLAIRLRSSRWHGHRRGAIWRVEVEPDHVAHLVDEGRITRQLEGLAPVRLQTEGPPDPRHHGLAHADPAGHVACRPVGRARRLLIERERDHRFCQLSRQRSGRS